MDVTYLGWQGLFISAGETIVVIDGLLVDEVGRGPRSSRVDFLFPFERTWRWDQLPPIAAYVITHEHEDHFNIATLCRIDRSVPLIVSARVSRAARTILAELGFSVRYVLSGETAVVGDLELTFFAHPVADEWDTLAYLVRSAGRGALFSEVDVSITRDMRDAVERLGFGDDRLVLYFNRLTFLRWSVSADAGDPSTHRPAEAEYYVGRPKAALSALRDNLRVLAHPGLTVRMAGERLCAVSDTAPFLEGLVERSIAHPFRKAAGADIASPVSGDPTLSPEEIAEIPERLAELAAALYGSELYRWVYALSRADAGDREPTYALCLLAGREQEDLVYAYRPEGCAFEPVDAQDVDALQAEFVGVSLMWARDFHSMSRGIIEPRTIGISYDELNVTTEASIPFWRSLWSVYHPQRIPGRVLDQYRRAVRDEGNAPLRLRCAATRVA